MVCCIVSVCLWHILPYSCPSSVCPSISLSFSSELEIYYAVNNRDKWTFLISQPSAPPCSVSCGNRPRQTYYPPHCMILYPICKPYPQVWRRVIVFIGSLLAIRATSSGSCLLNKYLSPRPNPPRRRIWIIAIFSKDIFIWNFIPRGGYIWWKL